MIFLTQNQSSEISDELKLWAQSQLGSEVHPSRMQSFLLSRLALKLALSHHIGGEVQARELYLNHFHECQRFPGIYASLSHTKDAAVAWVQDKRGFGIDLERRDREIKNSVWERIHNPKDSQNLDKVESWCLKEAIFKALFNAGHISGPIPFKDIHLQDNGNWSCQEFLGEYLLSRQDQKWQIAQAWLS